MECSPQRISAVLLWRRFSMRCCPVFFFCARRAVCDSIVNAAYRWNVQSCGAWRRRPGRNKLMPALVPVALIFSKLQRRFFSGNFYFSHFFFVAMKLFRLLEPLPCARALTSFRELDECYLLSLPFFSILTNLTSICDHYCDHFLDVKGGYVCCEPFVTWTTIVSVASIFGTGQNVWSIATLFVNWAKVCLLLFFRDTRVNIVPMPWRIFVT